MTKQTSEVVAQTDVGREAVDSLKFMGPNRLITFSEFATPEFWGVEFPEQPLTVAEIESSNIDRLRDRLLNPPRNVRFVQGYVSYPQPYVRVALTPGEYDLIPRSPDSLEAGAVALNLRQQTAGTPVVPDRAKAERAAEHRLEGRLGATQNYMTTIRNHARLIGRFSEASQYPQFNRGKMINIRADALIFMDYVIGNMLEALGAQRDWTVEQSELAQKSLQHRLFLDRSGNRHIREWRKLIELLGDYNGAKLGLMRDRIHKTETKISESRLKQQIHNQR